MCVAVDTREQMSSIYCMPWIPSCKTRTEEGQEVMKGTSDRRMLQHAQACQTVTQNSM